MKTLWIASDHAGWSLKHNILQRSAGYDWRDLGPINEHPSVDYPDQAQHLCETLLKQSVQEDPRGILICGTGIGMCICANKVPGIRAAVAHDFMSARLAREHNQTQVLCLGSRLVALEYALEILAIWLQTPSSSELRHQRRLEKIHQLDRMTL